MTTLKKIQNALGYEFRNSDLLLQALTHKSYYFENRESSKGDNEKLEFLGDAVLDLSVAELLIRIFPDDDEGTLSKKRASLVNEKVLAEIAVKIELGEEILLGKGEKASGGASKPKILSAAFEALVGAVFSEVGFATCQDLTDRFFTEIARKLEAVGFEDDYKTRLQVAVQEKIKASPRYFVVDEKGPDHEKSFVVEVAIKEEVLGVGLGRSKKAAEQAAAKVALTNWEAK